MVETQATNKVPGWSSLCEATLTMVFAAMPDPAIAIDTKGLVRLYNQPMQALFPEVSLTGKILSAMLPQSALAATMQSGGSEKWQRLHIHNKTYWANRYPLMFEGRIVGAFACLHDIGDLEEISSELKSVRLLMEEMDSIIEGSSDGIFVADGQGTTLRVNKAYEQITGLKREDVVGFSMQELVKTSTFDQSATLAVLKSNKPATVIQKIRTGRTVMVTGAPLFDSSGNIRRVVTTVRDLTELNRLRDELNVADSLKNQYEKELHDLKQLFIHDAELVFHSPPMRALLDTALRLGGVDSTVLIHGESGVGKEVVAELIHRNSPRAGKPFIKINCTAIPEALLESELFGYVGGAFTGARKEGKKGLFEAAHGGTLLLDEVGDLPLSLQVKLLRVIQNKEVRRVGDNTSHDVDIRLLAATNQNLWQMVEQKRFREDLYYRLNVVPVHVPPLRERKEDIVLMAQAFLNKFCKRHNKVKELHSSVIPLFLEYSWPGNVRELENLIERLVVTVPHVSIVPEDVPRSLHSQKARHSARTVSGESLKEIVRNVEREVLREAFARHKTTRKVAQALGLDQSNVVRKARQLGIDVRQQP